MKFHKSHIFSVFILLLAFYLIGNYGLDHTRYIGREIAAVLISLSVFLIIFDTFNLRSTMGDNASLLSTTLIMVGGFFIMFFLTYAVNSFLSKKEKKYLSGTIETTEGLIVGSKPRFNFSQARFSRAFKNYPIYVIYKYSVNGKSYIQGDDSVSIDKQKLHKLIKNKIPVIVEYSFLKPQVSKLLIAD